MVSLRKVGNFKGEGGGGGTMAACLIYLATIYSRRQFKTDWIRVYNSIIHTDTLVKFCVYYRERDLSAN